MAYPQSFLEELKMRNNLEDVIRSYCDLKRAGSNYTCCCPFHSEKTPSFVVFPEKNFYCFGCGAGGDVITFIMRIENLDYPHAIEHLAERAGLEVPKDEMRNIPKKKEILSRERNFAMNKAAARIFYENLISPDGKPGLDYFLERRLSMATIRHFGLGYAKNSFCDLYDKLAAQGYTLEEIKEGFLCGISKNGKPYDYFRNRVIFPIIDTSGNVLGFGGRRISEEDNPKYLNTSDTPVFKKSRNLFALNFAKNAASGHEGSVSEKAPAGELIMCEGYMDVISLHQSGFTGAVATLGTAITPEQARLISRYAKTLFVTYDSDAAGKRADERAIKLLSEVGVEVKMLKVTGGAKDPDEYIKKYGAESFKNLMTSAPGQIDYRLNAIIGKYNADIPEEKLAMLNEACMLIASEYSEMKREVYIMRLAEISGISKETVAVEVRRMSGKIARTQKKNFEKTTEDTLRHYGDRINPDAAKYIKAAETEEQILGILLLYPEYYGKANGLSEDIFVTDFGKNVFSVIGEIIRDNSDEGPFDFSALNEYFTPEQTGRIMAMYRRRKNLSVNDIGTLSKLCDVLKNEKERSARPKAEDMTADELAELIKQKREKTNRQ